MLLSVLTRGGIARWRNRRRWHAHENTTSHAEMGHMHSVEQSPSTACYADVGGRTPQHTERYNLFSLPFTLVRDWKGDEWLGDARALCEPVTVVRLQHSNTAGKVGKEEEKKWREGKKGLTVIVSVPVDPGFDGIGCPTTVHLNVHLPIVCPTP